MDVYEFYWRDTIKGSQPIGVLPGRRKNPVRRTRESVINLARDLLGDNVDANKIFFINETKMKIQVKFSAAIQTGFLMYSIGNIPSVRN